MIFSQIYKTNVKEREIHKTTRWVNKNSNPNHHNRNCNLMSVHETTTRNTMEKTTVMSVTMKLPSP